ncbi:branched-chain amino acid ABC transporter permease [Bordetella genomosp. 9]|uniref:Branched-chain amino acid ABC transporter permease n=1 Tax=Bordetella genomosp. 9 TaxID=1416803 RepID=A0A1W6YZR5_9BORD|nr:branched-chain amino acid ABC transporter permease [Bordetella genomosp. 9]ARP86556.1 branched-chain amino acid ABC transporter permease [Bordetella genomosp. 9]
MNDTKVFVPPLRPQRGACARTAARTWAGGLALAVLAIAPLALRDPFYLHLAIMVCINTITVSGLSLLARAGQLSLCHGAFVGVGAYMAVLAVMGLGLPFPVGVLAAMATAGLTAWLLGAIMLRLTGVYFVLVTFAFGELVRLVLLEWADITGGANGIPDIVPARLFGVDLNEKYAFYGLALTAVAIVLMLLHALYRSPAGHAIDSVGENAKLAEASGISVRGTQLFAFTLASALAGLGGALTAHYQGFISPESFNMHLSVTLIIIMVVGGRKALLGPLIGALVMTPLPELFRGAVESQNIFYGVALILMLRFLPGGLASLAGRANKAGERP